MYSLKKPLGRGFQFAVYPDLDDTDSVVKIPRWNLGDLRYDRGIKARRAVETGIRLLKSHIGSDYFLDSEVVVGDMRWWVKQRRLPPGAQCVSSDYAGLQDIKRQIEYIARTVAYIKRKTGLSLEWFGSDSALDMIKMQLNPNYWVLPNLKVTTDGKIMIPDAALIWTGSHSRFSGILTWMTYNPIFPAAYQVLYQPLLKQVEARSGINLTRY